MQLGEILKFAGRPEEAVASLEEYVASATGEDVEAVGKLIAVVKDQSLPSGTAELVRPVEKKVFTLDEARGVLPRVKELTSDAVFRYARLGEGSGSDEARQGIVRDWAKEVLSLGVEIKGLGLSGGSLDILTHELLEGRLGTAELARLVHGYEEGFSGRLPLQ